MFINNKYTKWYYQIIYKYQSTQINGYNEKHHIIPKSLGGDNSPDNLVKLTGRKLSDKHLANRIKGQTGAGNPAARAIIWFTNSGLTGEFSTITEGAKWCNSCQPNISKCLNSKIKSSGKHPETKEPIHWAYK